ncbi:hypothetical protein C5D98_14845 [Rathayibacter rathayi]|uniref:hypothetical protein n=1 Tax=Rathayibacter rathayi TaxID=33887 RepID=UPI000CE7C755|nr:hypothetical protein [Rathayibacter rathayi]PPG77459.1 hypothetical protein C5C15_09190 [Rathayibacter rathayi]PPI65227.1 hypothetical protein C5D98_14845 [Rathayibacter rathayi]
MAIDTAKLNEISDNLADLGRLLESKRRPDGAELWREVGAAFGGISEAIRELTAAAESESGGGA